MNMASNLTYVSLLTKNVTDDPNLVAPGRGGDRIINSSSHESDWARELLIRPKELSFRADSTGAAFDSSTTTTKRTFEFGLDDTAARIVIEVGTPPPHGSSNSEEALLNRSSVLFVAVSFILLMVISLAWLVFYYVQRFRYLHSKERVSRRLAELAKKAVARIPIKTLQLGDRETDSDLDQCAICIEPFRPLDSVRILPCRHYFHKVCIDPWLLEQRSCPMCKLDILQAYGMRTDLYLGCSNADPVTGSTRPLNFGTLQSGFASTSGSDDGLERMALIHGHPCGMVPVASAPITCTTPALAYVVLPTASSTNLSNVDSPATLYYVRPSSAEFVLSTVPGQNSSCSQSLDNQMIVSILPTLSLASHLETSPSNLIEWSSGLCITTHNPYNQYVTQSQLRHTQIAVQSYGHTSLVGVFQPHTVTSQLMPASVEGVISRTQDVTSTTQTFTAPVCSVKPECHVNDHSGDGDNTATSNPLMPFIQSSDVPFSAIVRRSLELTSANTSTGTAIGSTHLSTSHPNDSSARSCSISSGSSQLFRRIARSFGPADVHSKIRRVVDMDREHHRPSFMSWLPVVQLCKPKVTDCLPPFTGVPHYSSYPSPNMNFTSVKSTNSSHRLTQITSDISTTCNTELRPSTPCESEFSNSEHIVFAVVETSPYIGSMDRADDTVHCVTSTCDAA